MNAAEAIATLNLLVMSGDRVRIAYNIPGHKSDKQDPMSAEMGIVSIDTLQATCEMMGWADPVFTIYRLEDAMGIL